MSNALQNFLENEVEVKTNTPLTVRTPGRSDEVLNDTGSYVFKTDRRLERFLILGTDGGNYYADEKKLTKDNVEFVRKLIKDNERLVVDTLIDVSVNGRAVRQSPTLFTLALVLAEGKDKAYARQAVDKVVRTATHLYEFATYIDTLAGWGRAKRGAVADWFTSKDANSLAYQAVKYRSRTVNGKTWTLRDLMRLSHPEGVDVNVGNFILGKDAVAEATEPVILDGFREVQRAGNVNDLKVILSTYKNLPWEALPTQFLKDAAVWKTLFYNNQLNGQALVRNITRLARIDAFKDMKFAADYAARLTDEEMIERTLLHPINYLNAAIVHAEGQIERTTPGMDYWGGSRNARSRKRDWTPSSKIAEALNEGFHLAFKNVEPANKRTLVAVDVSSSMASFAGNGLDLSAAQIAAAVAMTIARTEPYSEIVGFSHLIKQLGITSKTSLDDAMRKVQDRNFGSTDVGSAIQYALDKKIDVDTFVIITDNQTNSGRKPTQVLREYRQTTGIDARLAVLAVTATDYSVADPKDDREMDFVGFDSSAPKILA